MKIADLQHGQVVTLRTGRAERHGVEWGEWQNKPLHIQRFKGRIVIIAIQDSEWAEYTPQDYQPPTGYHPYGVFTAEDWYMEIEGLE